jgi:hypothetical protein
VLICVEGRVVLLHCRHRRGFEPSLLTLMNSIPRFLVLLCLDLALVMAIFLCGCRTRGPGMGPPPGGGPPSGGGRPGMPIKEEIVEGPASTPPPASDSLIGRPLDPGGGSLNKP